MSKEEIKKYSFFISLIILLVVSFLIVRPFITALVSAFILAFITRPLFLRIEKKISRKIAALICVLIVLLAIIIPIILIIGTVLSQINSFTPSDSTVTLIKILEYGPLKSLNIDAEMVQSRFIAFMSSLLGSTIAYIPTLFINLFTALFSMYFILTNWEKITSTIQRYLPFKRKEKLINETRDTSKKILYGTLLVAVIEFIIATVGFLISGVHLYLVAAFIIFILAFIPGIGPIAVWVPMAIFYLASGNVYALIGVVITGSIITFYIEPFLFNVLVGKKSNINPAIMLVGVFGGIAYFGLFGFIMGPLILVFTGKILKTYLDDQF